MTLRTYNPGRKKPTRYFIENEDGSTVVWFDSLDTAGTVLRYLKGAPMQKEDAEAARAAMQAWDARKEGECD